MPGDVLPWFKMFAAETLSDENFSGWTCEERGAWLTLICFAWKEGSIPSDLEAIGRLLHLDGNRIAAVWHRISDRFVPHPNATGRLVSPRLEKERAEALALLAKRGEAGKAGATARWNRKKSGHGKRITSASGRNTEPVRLDGASASASASPEAAPRVCTPARARVSTCASTSAPEPEKATTSSPLAAVPEPAPGPASPPQGIPTFEQHVAATAPHVLELANELAASGYPLALPREAATRAVLEVAVKALTVPVAANEIRAALAARQASGSSPVGSLGWFANKLRELASAGTRPAVTKDIRVGPAAPADHSKFGKGGEYEF